MSLLLLTPFTPPPAIGPEDFYRFGRDALPQWVKDRDEFLLASAQVMTAVQTQTEYLFKQTLITTADGPTADAPDWLQQHARDRGTSRQVGESNAALAQRLRTIPDALTRQALLDAANAALATAGVAGSAALLELPRDGAFYGSYTALTGTGGAFTQVGTTSKFTPAALPWPAPPFQAASVAPVRTWQLVISGAAHAGNNGTRAITGLDGNAAIVTNAGGVAGADATVTWKAQRLDQTGNVTDGFHRAYYGRGFRWAQTRPFTVLVILPFGTDLGTQNSVTEALRLKKAAGFKVIVERRLNP